MRHDSGLSVTFPERVKLARTKRGKSQLALSKAAELSDAYVAQVESGGIQKPGYEAVANMARVLDVPVAWLAEGAGDVPDWGPEEQTEQSSEPAAE